LNITEIDIIIDSRYTYNYRLSKYDMGGNYSSRLFVWLYSNCLKKHPEATRIKKGYLPKFGRQFEYHYQSIPTAYIGRYTYINRFRDYFTFIIIFCSTFFIIRLYNADQFLIVGKFVEGFKHFLKLT